jgi:HK97 family phage portal protein
VYEQAAKQRNLDRGSVPWQLLHDEPNPEMDSMVFWELMTNRLEARGNAFAEIERDGSDQPIALWPIHNSRVQPWRVEGKVQWQISTDATDPRIEQYLSYMIPDRNMLNIVGFGGNGYLAPGTLPCAQEQVGFSIALQQYGSSFFKQGGKPMGVVEMPGYIDDEDERRQFRADLNALHTGRENWNKIGVLWHAGKWKEMQYGPEQVQMIASSNFSDKRICQFFRVPPAIVQIYDDYKFTSVDAMLQSFVMTCLRPIAVRVERGVNRKLMKYRDGKGRLVDAFDSPRIFEFLLEALLRGDAKKQAETLEIKRRNGITNANEWRALDNDAPLPGEQGNYYILPGGFGRLDLIQGPGAKADQQQDPAKGNQQPAKSEQLPAFDAQALVQAIQSSNLLQPTGNQSRGGSAANVDSIAREMGAEVLAEAIERVEAVAKTEMARLSKLADDQVRAAKLDELRGKHKARLVSAVLPAAKIFKRTDEWSAIDIDSIANELAGDALGKFFQGIGS